MLVIANGAFKHGSTWLFNILRQLTHFSAPPERYLNSNWRHPSIHPRKLRACLQELDYINNDFLVKNHFDTRGKRNLILAYPNVYLFDIERDVRDVVVSAYYHDLRLRRFYGDFRTYYWQRGRRVANGARLFHNLWKTGSSQVYVSSYERLQDDFPKEVHEIGAFLGFDLAPEEIRTIWEATSFRKAKRAIGQSAEPGEEDFYRKGVVGDWKNHFEPKMLEDIGRIEQRGLSPLEWTWLKIRALPREILPKILPVN